MTDGFMIAGGLAGLGGFLLSKANIATSAIRRHMTARVILYGEAREAVMQKISVLGNGSDVAYGYASTSAGVPEPGSHKKDDDFGHRFAPGPRLVKIDGRRVMVEVQQEKFDYGYVESATLLASKAHLAWLKQYVETAIWDRRNEMAKGLPVYVCRGSWWDQVCVRPFRPMDTIEHPRDSQWRILDAIEDWKSQESAKVGRGENFHIGFLLHGPGGTGKTSTAIAVASHLRRPLYVLNPTKSNISSLTESLTRLPDNCILLVEECEQLFPIRAGEDVETDREVANALSQFDGPFSKHGIIRIYTTNHPDRLDRSFRGRAGRCDFEFEFPARVSV